ncbi:MAG: long-chain fatty acid--CoA ligase [Actinomycetota bacterium]
MSVNIGALLAKRALLSPGKEAVVCEGVRRTWVECNARANRLAHAMQKLGVKRGDTVGLLALNEAEFLDMYYGLGKIGAILVPVNYRLAAPEISYILNDCGAKVFIFGKEYAEIADTFRNDIPAKHFVAIMDSPPEWAKQYEALIQAESAEEPEAAPGGDDVITILYTSGTTGRPKGAMLTHTNFYTMSINFVTTFGWPGDTDMIALPLFHIGALAPLASGVYYGMRSVMLRSLDPKRFLELLGEEKVDVFGSVPALLMILKMVPDFEKYDWSSVKLIFVFGAPVPVSLLEEYAAAGIEVRNLYGLTESTGSGTVIDGEYSMAKVGSCGLPEFLVDAKVVDEDGNEVGPEELGEVVVRGETIMKGYWNKPEETAATIKDGWLHTGDVARRDADGFFYIMDRKKDMIISGGENIYPAEIEDVLSRHPKIAEVGVIGYEHEKWGEAVKAIVVLRPGETLTEDELMEWTKGKIGKFKMPKKVEFTDALPRTATGKILKRLLRDQFNK